MSSSHFISAGPLRQPLSESQNQDAAGSALASLTRKHPAQSGSLGRQRGHPPPALADPAHRSLLPHRAGPRRDRLRQAARRARHPRPLDWRKRPIHRRQRQCARRIHRQRRSRARRILAIRRFPAQSANGGTLYLDSVGELPFTLQAALFRFIRACEERRSVAPPASRNDFRRSEPARIDTRILASTDRDLRVLASIGQFRQDLYARLSAVEILVPPLRQRIEDIPTLVAWLLRRIAGETGQVPKLLAKSTLAQLQERLWPNNLRELERVVAQAAALAEGTVVEPRHLLALVEPANASPASRPPFTSSACTTSSSSTSSTVLTRCGGNKLRAAEMLGISRSTLYRMLDAAPSPPTPALSRSQQISFPQPRYTR